MSRLLEGKDYRINILFLREMGLKKSQFLLQSFAISLTQSCNTNDHIAANLELVEEKWMAEYFFLEILLLNIYHRTRALEDSTE